MATPTAPPKPEKRRRQDREFRIMFRPLDTRSDNTPVAPTNPGPSPPRRKVSHILGLKLPPSTLVDDLCSKLVEKSSHWALVVLKAPYDPEARSIPVTADDPRIERVFEIGRISPPVTGEEDEEALLEGRAEHWENSSWGRKNKGKEVEKEKRGKGKWKGKGKEKSTGQGTKGKTNCTSAIVPPRDLISDDSSEDDRHEDDEGFPSANKTGESMEMRVSEKLRVDFKQLQCEHLGGPLWEILTGIEARTKFSNTELKHEGMFLNLISRDRLVIDDWSKRRASGNGSRTITCSTIIAKGSVS
ncbi:hypothetical protein Q9L58_006545 [Maublancomyces gigas]|uniref:Uncharacterized protein n=1 Tax=Discina gigas TaxID=1032678 RepID=A0ABR3GG49_9PEZI